MAQILLADDSASVRLLLATVLAGDGHNVIQVADGMSAFALLTSETFDVAILDVSMPGLNGLTLCRRLRDTAGLVHLAVVIMSADASEAAALASGADAFFSKPFSPARLRTVVNHLVAGFQGESTQAPHRVHEAIWPPSGQPDAPLTSSVTSHARDGAKGGAT